MENKKDNACEEEKELLREQFRLLAEKSRNGFNTEYLAALSEQMVKIYLALQLCEDSCFVTSTVDRLFPETVSAQEKITGRIKDCNKCGKWKEKEVYYDRETGAVQRISYSEEKQGKTSRKLPLKIEVRLKRADLDDLLEVAEKVDALRNEYPFTDTHFIIEC